MVESKDYGIPSVGILEVWEQQDPGIRGDPGGDV